MPRPCFLVVDEEFPGSISSRKLVIETAKYNVITAYSKEEAFETLRRFPNVDGVVMGTSDGPDFCRKMVEEYRAINSKVPLILTSSDAMDSDHGADHAVPSFSPAKLLEKLQSLSGHSEETLRSHEHRVDKS